MKKTTVKAHKRKGTKGVKEHRRTVPNASMGEQKGNFTPKFNYTKKQKNITQNEFLFGDFDKDGIKNIDDSQPFKKTELKDKGLDYYKRSKFYSQEVLLSKELRAIQNNNNEYADIINDFRKKYPDVKFRIKSVPSTLKKLRVKYIDDLRDIGGMTILVDTRDQVYTEASKVKKQYKYDASKVKDYYKSPKDGMYYAYHIPLIIDGKTIELQIKTKKMYDLQMKAHYDYKQGGDLKKYTPLAKELYNQGY